MRDSRISNNPSNQNEEYYTLTSFRKGFDGRVCDYYIPFGLHRSRMKKEGFVIRTTPPEYPVFTGITIHNEKAKNIILSVNWNLYAAKTITAFILTYGDFHIGYNENA